MYPLVLVNPVGKAVAEAAQSMLEFMSDSIGKVSPCRPPASACSCPPRRAPRKRLQERMVAWCTHGAVARRASAAQAFELRRDNPFSFRCLRLLSGLPQLSQLQPGPKVRAPGVARFLAVAAAASVFGRQQSSCPSCGARGAWRVLDLLVVVVVVVQVVLATSASLERGPARQLFLDLVQDERNTVCFVQRPPVRPPTPPTPLGASTSLLRPRSHARAKVKVVRGGRVACVACRRARWRTKC